MAKSDDNKRLVREAFRPWEAGDSGLFFALVADDVRWTVMMREQRIVEIVAYLDTDLLVEVFS